MPTHALVIVEFAKPTPAGVDLKQGFEVDIGGTVRRMPEIERPTESVFVIPLKNGLHPLSQILSAAYAQKHKTRTLFFDQEPPFVVTEPPT